MSIRYRCALCGKTEIKANLVNHVCQTCLDSYEVESDWAQELIKIEQQRIEDTKRSGSFKILNFSELVTYNNNRRYTGDDMVAGEIAFPSRVNKSSRASRRKIEHPKQVISGNDYLDLLEIVMSWGEQANLNEKEQKVVEITALFAQKEKLSFEEASRVLSEIEDKTLTPDDFEALLNRARQKLRAVGISPT